MKRVFITGASSGLGEALAREYASRGARLGLLARRSDKLQALVASLPNSALHLCYAVDVNEHTALSAAAEDFITRTGGVDVVIANAGVSFGTLTGRDGDVTVIERILQTNVVATAATFAPFIATMKAQAAAGSDDLRLVGIASVAGIRGLPGAEAYSASKAAMISYCESLRVELRSHGIRVVTIAPGYIDTPMTQVNTYRMPFLMPAERFARSAVRVIEAGRSYAVIPWPMRVVSWILKLMPNWLFDVAFARAPHKPSAQDIEGRSSR